ncbi:MAG: sugar phosphate isomerase/epimerase, partial [Clostridia bacterium]|nr:sugar phosphate isomerase/epimerase [Clostridia bacterium]
MKKGIRGHDVSVTGLCNICKRCKELDIGYLQLVLEKSIVGFESGKFTEEYANSIKEQLGDMEIAVLGSYINPSNPDDELLNADIEKFKEKIRYASVLKPIVVGTETGRYMDGLTDSEEAYQRVLKTFKELVPYAEESGVNIGIEGVHCFVINTPEKMKRLLNDLDSDNVKVIFDPVNLLNINNYQNQDDIITETFDLLADKICVLHAKDFKVENGNFTSTK